MPTHGSKGKKLKPTGSMTSVFSALDAIKQKKRRNQIALVETAPRGSKAAVAKRLVKENQKKRK